MRRKYLNMLLLVLAVFSCNGTVTNLQPASTVSVAAGEDYSLPSYVLPDTFSGLVGNPSYRVKIKHFWVNWSDLEPSHGVYDFSKIQTQLTNATNGNYKLCLYIQSIVTGGENPGLGITIPSVVPSWVLSEFGLTEINLGWTFNIRIIPAWDARVKEAFHDMLKSFGEAGYPQSEELACSYIHGISPSRGEEFWLDPSNISDLEADHAFNASVMETWIKERIDAYSSSFGTAKRKLAWVGNTDPWSFGNIEAYSIAQRNLIEHAWGKGIGNRGSIVEMFNYHLTTSSLGQSVDDDGYLYTDETLPPILSGSYFGDENEEYGSWWEWRFGPIGVSQSGEKHRFRMSMMRALQMRLKFLWTSDAAETVNPELSEYAYLSLGKTVENSPDAWAYLRESPQKIYYSPSGVLKNFERWLIQRDIEGGMTLPYDKFERGFDAGGSPSGQTFDYISRRTDTASGNKYIYFDLDDRFIVDGTFEVKVEYKDWGLASWGLQYTNHQGIELSTPKVTNLDSGTIKTATFRINNGYFQNAFDHEMDFRIFSDGPGDVALRWVRVIRNRIP